MYIVLVRHGQTEENATGRQIADSELTDLGREQAALLAERLSGERFDRIFSSPLVRALDTAKAIARCQPNKIEVVYGLRELREAETHICLTGRELNARYPGAIFPGDIFKPDEGWVFSGDETRELCKIRAGKTFEYIKSVIMNEDKILIVSHVGFITGFFCSLLSQDAESFRIGQENTAQNRLEIKDGRLKLISINDAGHLKK
jgi:2,3-bisphosphoglycerate-dependent phosphoglycerate mutase/probable phosphoglycerate mutase